MVKLQGLLLNQKKAGVSPIFVYHLKLYYSHIKAFKVLIWLKLENKYYQKRLNFVI
jgi:hypothetical protein